MPSRALATISAALLFAFATAGFARAQAPTTVILVRHAEKAAAPAKDPPLTDAGRARAAALLDAIRDAGVEAIITTEFARTRETGAPAAAALHIAPEVVGATSKTHVHDVAAAVMRHAGHTVLVVGHSNTIPAIIAALGAPEPSQICDAEYDDLFIVTVPAAGKPTLVRAKYGARSDVSSCAAMK